MIANNQELIHCVALSRRYLSLLIRGLTSTFAADEGTSPLLNLNSAYQMETAHTYVRLGPHVSTICNSCGRYGVRYMC